MKRDLHLTHEFVEFIPPDLKANTIYVSIRFATAVHKCCCGCGSDVVTPLSPTDWKLIFDGKTVSLYPSIGNWSFDCQSHYWVRRNEVIWARRWSQKEIGAARNREMLAKERYFNAAETATGSVAQANSEGAAGGKPARGFWRKPKKRR